VTRVGAAGAVVVMVLLAGCGGGSSALTLPAGAARQLQAQVAAVRADAVGLDPAAARRDLTNLETTVRQLGRSGQIPAVRAASILAAAHAVENALVLLPTTTTTTTTTTPPPPHPGPHPDRPKHSGDDPAS